MFKKKKSETDSCKFALEVAELATQKYHMNLPEMMGALEIVKFNIYNQTNNGIEEIKDIINWLKEEAE